MTWKGVNLGGWLVLERWISPSLFEGLKAQDEHSFCTEAGEAKAAKIAQHRQTFISEEDFRWLAKSGINALRIPIPHWLFGNVEPYIGGIEFLDQAMDWAAKYDFRVILDIHTAPGSQNGRAHSGVSGEINWYKNKNNISISLEFLSQLCQRYGQHPNLLGIELLNEPRAWIKPSILKNYYKDGYKIVRKYCGDEAQVIISDYFAPWRWSKFMPEPQFSNVIRDTHLYQCHKVSDKKLTMDQHIEKASAEWKSLLSKMQRDKSVIIGEWSLALSPETFAGMTDPKKKIILNAYADAQLTTFNTSAGWFYWTYKTEEENLWNFRYCLETCLIRF